LPSSCLDAGSFAICVTVPTTDASADSRRANRLPHHSNGMIRSRSAQERAAVRGKKESMAAVVSSGLGDVLGVGSG
jgi:hypothetical protein